MFADVAGPSFIFWPVGCGDTTTMVVSESEVVQIDINDKLMADEQGNEHIPIVDELVAKLPKRDGKPYLSCFVLTHPDLDHCRGFKDLLKRVTIGEIWHTPRIFLENGPDLNDEALSFRAEARRRAKLTIDAAGDPGAGNRVRIIGYSDHFQPGKRFYGFPDQFKTRPGSSITVIDGADVSDRFHAFVHAPFKEGLANDRNETSLAMRVIVGTTNFAIRGLFLGDLSYPTIMQIFEETHAHGNDRMLEWHVLLAPHHCSKKVMYERDDFGSDVLQQDVLDELSACQLDIGYIVTSSNEFPHSNSPGDNPPHRKARNRYEEIVNTAFVCTGEFSTPEDVRPIIFTATAAGIVLAGDDYQMSESAENTLAAAIAAARGTNAPPATKVGFGTNEV